ncbi:MAG: HAD-IA family hydrolase [Bacilli bacterium]
MKRFIIFDLDGTLIDTCGGITVAVNNTLKHFNYPFTYLPSEVKYFLGHGARYLYSKATKKEEIDENEYNFFTVEYVKTQGVSKPYPSVKETLQKLYRKGYGLLIFSNKPNGALQFLIKDKLGDIPWLAVQGNVPEYPAKPNPTLLNKVISDLGLTGEEGYYVGDCYVDVETANNAKLKSIILKQGYGDYEGIYNYKPDYVIDDFKGLVSLFKDIDNEGR